MSAPHRFFTADCSAAGWAIYFQARPVETEHEGRAVAPRLPILRASESLANPADTLPRLAAILDRHWSDGTPA